ncbi:MAG: septum formation initiator family protein [Clostridia bacterium]|nr:septum formation initiator family protein [Clostridia bacterium]
MKATFAKKKSWFFRIALIALAVYIVVSLIQLNLQLNEKQQLLNDWIQKTEQQNLLNADLQDQGENYESYLEQQAREEQGMAKPGETVLYEVPKE